jgi:hypothetical protein
VGANFSLQRPSPVPLITDHGGEPRTRPKAPSARYIATDALGNPLDTDGDSIPDYIEDSNGNGIYDTGDFSDWQAYTSPNGLTSGSGLQVFTPLK